MLESLEGREVPSATSAVPNLAPALTAPLASAVRQVTSILPITINSVTTTATGGLQANASIGQTNFAIPLTLTTSQSTNGTPILNLHLGEIHLNLLGLKVDTSEICLNITAQPGPGNLLGNLLSNVTNLLNQGQSLGQILGNLTANQLGTLTTGLTDVLNGALGALTSPTNVAGGASVSSTSTTHILHLAVGPLNLNLLGLQVNLDNCHGGPITVDITAQSGPGNLLGNLLGGLSHLLDSSANTNALLNKLGNIANQILSLI